MNRYRTILIKFPSSSSMDKPNTHASWTERVRMARGENKVIEKDCECERNQALVSSDFGIRPSRMTSVPLGMGLPKLPCCPRVGVRPPPEISPGAWSPGTGPSALDVWGGEMGRPKQTVRSKSLHALKILATNFSKYNSLPVFLLHCCS